MRKVLFRVMDWVQGDAMPRRHQHAKEYLQLGLRISGLRKSRGWTQSELAQNAGLSASYLAEVERGGRNPSLETILNLAAALDVNAGYLVDGVPMLAVTGMENLPELWMGLSKSARQVLVQVASLLAPHSRSSSDGNSRAKTSK